MQLLEADAETKVVSFGRREADVCIVEGDCHVKTLHTEEELFTAYHLRHQVMSEELGWVPINSRKQEQDDYDRHAISLGVFDKRQDLRAYLRIVTSEHQFMLEKEFPFLMRPGSKVQKRKDTVEVSRLCVKPEARQGATSTLLYKGLYHWCLANKKRYLYLVVEQAVHRLLCVSGFPCQSLGEPKIMPDGVIAVAAILDWREFERNNSPRHSQKIAWFRQLQSGLPRAQWQQHVSC